MGIAASTSTPLESCLNTVCAGRSSCVGYPSDPLYSLEWSKPYNLDVPVTPVAVVRPTSAQDVSGFVKCAASSNVKVQAKSGGHSYANYGLGGSDGALMIDMVNMQDFSMDNTTWHATVGSGTLLGDLTTKMSDAGGRAMAHGVCPGVGIGGHATIGGLGPMSRMWGTCLDHVIEVEVVTADGSIVRANNQTNADLYWGLKGAGASFGVITEFVVYTHPEPGNVVQYTYSFSFGSQAQMAPVYQAWQDLIADPDLDRRFATELIVQPLGILITTTFYGTQEDWNASGIPQKVPAGGSASLVLNDWLGSIAHEAENEGLYLSNLPSEFYSKSLAFRIDDLLSADAITSFFSYLDTVDTGTLVWFIIFDQTGGAIADVPADATAYPHRDKIMFYQSYAVGIPTLSDTTKSFLAGVHTTIKNYAVEANTTYAGYVDPALVGPDSGYSYWGANYLRLQQVKQALDPSELFHNPASVSPSA